MHTIREELKKIYHFLLLLVLLYAVNLGFNMLYDWGGVSVIVRVYIMVLSCYIVYNFSQLDAEGLREAYRKEYGRMGAFYLFIVLRIFPFLFIYLMTVIFTLINYIQNPNWPVDTILRLMDGRYSNTVIYALILYIVLRLKIRPGIAIPVFITAAILYFYVDKLLYSLFEPGAGVSVIKLSKFTIFYFILLYGYSKLRVKIIHSVSLAAVSGAATYASLIVVYFLFFTFSDPGGHIYSNSAKTLLKYGFNQVFDSYEKSVGEQNSVKDVPELILFSEKAGKNISFAKDKWENFVMMSGISDAEKIFRYLKRKNIILDFTVISRYASLQSVNDPDNLLKGSNFKKYFALYYGERSGEFFTIYNTGDIVIKKWIIDVLGYIHDYESIHFLINRLTDVDRKISERAYASLKRVTRLDPAEAEHKEYHDLDVVDRFREYAEKLKAE